MDIESMYKKVSSRKYSIIIHIIAGLLILFALYCYIEDDLVHAQLFLLFSMAIGIGGLYHGIIEYGSKYEDSLIKST